MPQTPSSLDPRVDAYIAKSAAFAQPVLIHLREVVHAACPGAQETLKWGMPTFMHGRKILAHMAAFKAHCAFGFWQDVGVPRGEGKSAMGQFGRIETLKDLPSKAALGKLIRQAAKQIDEGVKPPGIPKPGARPPPEAPPDLLAALRRSAKARKTFEAFPPSKQREYVDWLVEAKREDTREKRLAQSIEWMEEGKSRHWKYQGC